VVSGRLFVDESTVRFHLKEETADGATVHPKMARNLTVKNEFAVPVSPRVTRSQSYNFELCTTPAL
jgi:hypothetical protein